MVHYGKIKFSVFHQPSNAGRINYLQAIIVIIYLEIFPRVWLNITNLLS